MKFRNLEDVQYYIFRWVLFIFFLASTYKLVDAELHIHTFVVIAWTNLVSAFTG